MKGVKTTSANLLKSKDAKLQGLPFLGWQPVASTIPVLLIFKLLNNENSLSSFPRFFDRFDWRKRKMKKTIITLATAVMMFLGAAAPFTTIQAHAAEQTQTMDSELLHDINQLRAEKGLPALILDNSLNNIAEIRSNEIIDNWSHTRPDGTSGCDMISADNYRGENLSYISYDDFDFSASDQTDAADDVFSSLKASQAHYDNMVNSNYTKIGIRTSVSQTSDGIKLSTAYMFSN